MSSMWTIGRQGVPSLLMWTRPSAYAQATRLFSTRSKRRRGETPYAVALRRNVGLNALIRQLRHVLLDADLRDGVGRDRVKLGRLVHEIVAGFAVAAARGGVEEARHAGLLCEPREAHRGGVVDVVRDLRIQVAQRIVGERGQVDDGVESFEVRRLHVPQVDAQLTNVLKIPG